MRMHRTGRPKMLYREVNTTTRHRSNHPGGEYRWERHSHKRIDEHAPLRVSMHGRAQRGRDYAPLFMFLLSKVGQCWDAVYSEAVRRLDKPEPIFWLVAMHEDEKREIVCCDESSYYHGLYVDEAGKLQKVNPAIDASDVTVHCRCCTHTFNGVPLTACKGRADDTDPSPTE